MKTVPQIRFKQSHKRYLHATDILPLPNNSPFGNLTLKHSKVHIRLRWINAKIEAAYMGFESVRKAGPAFSLELYEHQFMTEEIIYWLRKSADEIIGLVYILELFQRNGKFPKTIEYDRIGAFEDPKKADAGFVALFSNHLNFLKTLNRVANAYKHSFLNSDFNLVSRDDLQVMAWASNNRAFDNGRFYCVPLEDIVVGFSEFYETCLQQLEIAINKLGLVSEAVKAAK